MSKAEQFEALALRCEQATGPDRELDADIWLLCVPGAARKHTSYFHKASGRECVIDETRDVTGRLIIVPAYSASLDAALTLVPDGSPASLIIFANKRSFAECEDDNQREAATPALALCAAALRARAQMERGK